MLKRAIDGWNAAPGAPAGWNPERDGECGALPIRVHPPNALDRSVRVEWCESAWEPTPRELEAIIAGRSIILRVIGWQVPVALYVDAGLATGEIPVEERAAWVISYEVDEISDEVFEGFDAKGRAFARFAVVRGRHKCQLFREVARS